MIHDASVEVTCDNQTAGCRENVWVPIPWTLGGYDADDADIERKLVEEEWIVAEGRHFCSQGCAETAK